MTVGLEPTGFHCSHMRGHLTEALEPVEVGACHLPLLAELIGGPSSTGYGARQGYGRCFVQCLRSLRMLL
jgi:hypothetical protein